MFAFPDGDVATLILTCMPDSEVNVMHGIGGAPEDVVSAAVIRAIDGDMQTPLPGRHEVKSDNEENRHLDEQERQHCAEMGIKACEVLKLEQLVRNDNVIFAATGITRAIC